MNNRRIIPIAMACDDREFVYVVIPLMPMENNYMSNGDEEYRNLIVEGSLGYLR